ncbi:MAG: hypothetical protein OEW92_12075 [Gammaproteobacteria bacterium]|nr:hypothetical protein [Gammaproteobacteria bacterium]MDH5173150.1 hypothetical protein [Gammaproteobacteria bacterium]
MAALFTTLALMTLAIIALGYAAAVLSATIERQKTQQLVAIRAKTLKVRDNRDGTTSSW